MLELIQHKLPFTTKTVIFDCLNNYHSQRKIRNSNHFLQITPSGESQAFFFNSSFKAVTNITKFHNISQPQCIVFTGKKEYIKILTCNSSSINLYRAKIDSDRQFEHPFQQFSFPIKLDQNDKIIYVSDPILLGRQEYYIAYTKNDDFYLISVQYQAQKYQVNFNKLVDSDTTTSFFSWFKKSQKPHYDTIKLILINPMPGENILRAVSIRDNKIMTHQIKINENIKKSSIEVTFRYTQLQQIIGNQNKILDTVNISKNVLENYSQVSFISIFLEINTINIVHMTAIISHKQTSFNSQLLVNIAFAGGFSLIFLNQNYFMSWFNSSTNKFTLSCFQSAQFQTIHSTHLKRKPLLEQVNEIHLSANDKSLFAITSNTIYQYSSHQSHASQTQINQRVIRHNRQKIEKCLQIEDYNSILTLLKTIYFKYNEISESINDSFQSRVCIFILIKVLENKQLPILQQYLKKTSSYIENQINLLDEACSSFGIQETKGLIDFIAKTNLYSYLIDDILNATIIQFNKNEQLHFFKSQQRQVLIYLFDNSIEYILKQLRKKPLNNTQQRCLYELLINSIVFFKRRTSDMIQPLVDINEEFAKNTIINYQDTSLFIHFFSKYTISSDNETIKSKIQFNLQDLKEFTKNLKDNSKEKNNIQSFIKNLLLNCHRQWRHLEKNCNKSAYLAFMKYKISILVRGLEDYSEQVIPHLKSTYPGLTLFFYLKKNRKNGALKIQTMAQSCTNPEAAYIMNLSVADYNLQSNQAIIDTNRLCRQLLCYNLNTEALLQTLKNLKQMKVKQETWQKWKQSHIHLQKEINQIESKVQFFKDK